MLSISDIINQKMMMNYSIGKIHDENWVNAHNEAWKRQGLKVKIKDTKNYSNGRNRENIVEDILVEYYGKDNVKKEYPYKKTTLKNGILMNGKCDFYVIPPYNRIFEVKNEECPGTAGHKITGEIQELERFQNQTQADVFLIFKGNNIEENAQYWKDTCRINFQDQFSVINCDDLDYFLRTGKIPPQSPNLFELIFEDLRI